MPIEKTKSYCRMRIKSPKLFDKKSFRTVKPDKNTMLTVGCPAKQYNKKTKRCKVGMQLQSVAVKHHGKSCPAKILKRYKKWA